MSPPGPSIATTRMPTVEEEDRFRAAALKISDSMEVGVERGPGNGTDPTSLILAIAAGLMFVRTTILVEPSSRCSVGRK